MKSGMLAGASLLVVFGLFACAPKPKEPAYNTSLPVSELMAHVVDPAAWAVWHSSGTVDTLQGQQSLAPTTDDGWLAAESGGAAIAEAGNLLMLPGRARDDGDWMKYAAQLSQAGLDAKAAAEAKDPQKEYATGAAIYQVCTACHAKYYLPFVPKDTSWPEHPQLPPISAKDIADLKGMSKPIR
ncbi:MAG: hypothetical protein ACHP7N_06530 [Caulobacterales bacterium]